jgi:GNAT superfamily N-acetyltransferase
MAKLGTGERYEPFAQTKRFDIFRHRVVRSPDVGLPRDLFTAWYREEDVPRPVCEIVLFVNPYGVYVEWAHVCEKYRRQGIATEVLAGIEKRWGPFDMSGATPAGEKFVAAYGRKKNTTKTSKTTKKAKRVTRKRN